MKYGIIATVVAVLAIGGASIANTKKTNHMAPSTNNPSVSSEISGEQTDPVTTLSEPDNETPSPLTTPEPTPDPVHASAANCNPNYNPCVPNSSSDLDCADISFIVRVIGQDVYRLDRDGDGYGCESY